MADFFISYNKADRRWAEWIAWQLEEADYTTVLQAWDFTPGTNFVLKMHEAAKEAERTIAVLSPDYLTSIFAAPEWAAAFAQDPMGEKGLLIPLRVRKCDPEGLLAQIVVQDIGGVDEAASKAALLAAVKRGRAKPETKPAFPPTAGRSVTSRPRFPGALPPIWNVPHRRNPNFTGREELLESLHVSLHSGEYAALTQAMHGLGGVGKTQTAIEYAYRYASEYDAVLWVPAEDPAALAGHFAALAGVIGLNVDLADQPAAVAAVQRWLRENSRWLLIFDNSVAAADIQSYLPQTGTGHVIITSRNPEWRRIAKPLPVQRFAPEEAIAFLLARGGRDAEDGDERTAAAALARELGGLALALEQAAAYVETHALSLREYFRLFQQYGEKVLSVERSADYPHTIETVWTISFTAVKSTSSVAAELLALLAFFASDDIPLALIHAGSDIFPAALAELASDELKLQEAIRILRQHSLLEVDEEGLSIHRVVQAVTRNTLSDTDRRSSAELAILSLHAALQGDPRDVSTWRVFSRLASHVSTAAAYCEAEGTRLAEAAFCLNSTGLHLMGIGDYQSAKIYLEQSVRMYKKEHGPDNPNFAAALNNLGAAQQEMNDLPGALASCQRALEIVEGALGPDDPVVATCVNNLGSVQRALGKLSSARASFQRALRIEEQAVGPNHPRIAACVNNLGGLQRLSGDLSAARASYERALRIDEAAYGLNHPDVASDLNNLGIVLEAQGDFAGARLSYERALAILRSILGNDHPKTQVTHENLESLLSKLRSLPRRHK